MAKIGWGIDVGVGSIGFALIGLGDKGEPEELIDGVVEIFPAATGAADRRTYRSIRRQNERTRQRKKKLKTLLATIFDLPDDFNDTNARKPDNFPQDTSRVRLRAKGLGAPLSKEELAYAIMHVATNRGQRLSRGLSTGGGGSDGRADDNPEETQSRAKWTRQTLIELGRALKLDRAAYPAELLHQDEAAGKPTRLRKDRDDAPIFTRQMVMEELDELLTMQADTTEFRDILTDDTRTRIMDQVFWEAESPPPRIGKCRYGLRGETGEVEDRLPVGTDLFQCKRLYEEINNIRVIDGLSGMSRPLELDERDKLAAIALSGTDLTAAKVRSTLGLGKGKDAAQTNLDIAKQAKGRKTEATIKAHQIAAAFKKGDAIDIWQALDRDRKEEVAHLLRTEDDFEIVSKTLSTLLNIADEKALTRIANHPIPQARSAAGPTATGKILMALHEDVISHYEAVQRAGLDDGQADRGGYDRLPYYGVVLPESCVGATEHPADPLEEQLGRIPNPVVHLALNRIRKIGNAFIKKYGKPDRICIELARDLNKSAVEREEAERIAIGNGRKNDGYIEAMVKDTPFRKRRLSRDDLLKFRLHRMQGGKCLYTGEELSIDNLFDGTTAIDHILPRAQTLDDGISNLALVTQRSNNHKANRTPHEAFSSGYLGRDYAHILEDAKKRGPGVFWRFQPNAMEKFVDDAEFRERFLTDTRHIGKAARAYLATVCSNPNGVICVNGRLTGLLRHQWGLNGIIRELMEEGGALPKDELKEEEPDDGVPDQLKARRERQKKLRLDHRHHLLDAIVAGCTRRADVQRISTVAARFDRRPDADELERMIASHLTQFANTGICWQEGFRAEVKSFLENDANAILPERRPGTRVLHKTDHNPQGELHKKTNYAILCHDPDNAESCVVKVHKDLASLSLAAGIGKKLGAIDDFGTADRVVQRAIDKGSRLYWGGDDPVQALANLKSDLTELKNAITDLSKSAPDEHARNEDTRLKWAIEEYGRRTGRRRFVEIGVKSIRILKRDGSLKGRPLLAAETQNNHCTDIFLTPNGDWDWHVVKRIDAAHGDIRLPDGAKLLMRLHADDIVEMLSSTSSDAERKLYRLAHMSPNDLNFLPIDEARPVREVALEQGLVRVRSIKKFKERAPVPVLFDKAGRVRWRGRSGN